MAESPDIVVATPARAAQNLQNLALSVDKLAHLVIDEADLVLSYGYEDDLQTIADAVPKGVQTFLMSATLTTDVDAVKGLFCRDPLILDFQESASDSGGVSQYVVQYVSSLAPLPVSMLADMAVQQLRRRREVSSGIRYIQATID